MSNSSKVIYVDPNKLFETDDEYNMDKLNIGVKLDVSIPNRALNVTNNDIVATWNSTSGRVSVLEGTNGVLSTSYTDTSYEKDINGGDKESFGIESINITYQSWYYPEVDIKFVDIRGDALMNPIEATRDGNSSAVGSFFRALFSFPYPQFNLTVKGFYGEPVKYKLAVRDLRSSLNSETGNFDVNVKFIGYNYGSMTDIPMKYAIIAPFCKYGKTNFDEESTYLGNFEGVNAGKKIPTFLELVERMVKLTENISKTMANNREAYQLTQNEDKKNMLTEILSKLSYFYKDSNVFVFGDKTYTLVYKGNEAISKIKAKKEGEGDDEAIDIDNFVRTKEIIEEIRKDVALFNEKYGEDKDWFTDFMFLKENGYSLEENSKIPDDFERKSIVSGDSEDYGWVLVNEKMINSVKGKIKEVVNDSDTKRTNFSKEVTELIEDESNLGFVPTISSIFQIVKKHVECFNNRFKDCISSVDKDASNRKIKNEIENTDIPEGGSVTIPPFPLVKKKDNDSTSEIIWMEELSDISSPLYNLEEKNFVNALHNASTSSINDLNKALEQYDKTSETMFGMNFIPSLPCDLVSCAINPYSGISEFCEKDISPILLQFTRRLLYAAKKEFYRGHSNAIDAIVYKYMFENSFIKTEDDANMFGAIEAYNCFQDIKTNDEIKKRVMKFEGYNNIGDDVLKWMEGETTETIDGRTIFDLVNSRTIEYHNIHNGKSFFPILLNKTMYPNNHTNENYISYISWSENTGTTVPDSYETIGTENLYTEKEFDAIKNKYNSVSASSGLGINGKEFWNKNRNEAFDRWGDVHFIPFGGDNEYFSPVRGKKKDTLLKASEVLKNNGDFSVRFGRPTAWLLNYGTGKKEYSYNRDVITSMFYLKPIESLAHYNEINGWATDKLKGEISNDERTEIERRIRSYFFLRMIIPPYPEYPFNTDKKTNYGLPQSLRDKEGVVYLSKAEAMTYGAYFYMVKNKWINYTIEQNGTNSDLANEKDYSYPISNSLRDSFIAIYEDWYINKWVPDWYEGYSVKMYSDGLKDNWMLDSNLNIDSLVPEYRENRNSDEDDLNPNGKYIQEAFAKHESNWFGISNKYDVGVSLTKEGCDNIKELMTSLYVAVVGRKSSPTKDLPKEDDNAIVKTVLRNKTFDSNEKVGIEYDLAVREAATSFFVTLKNLYETEGTEERPLESYYANNQMKLSMYLTLKNLYDRWGYGKDGSVTDDDNSYDFKFIDSGYNDIGDKLMVNPDEIYSMLTKVLGNSEDPRYQGMSVYEFLSEICQKSNMMFMSLPVNIFDNTDAESFSNIFKPFTFMETNNMDKCKKNTYVAIYPNKPSEHLNFGSDENMFADDGADFLKNPPVESIDSATGVENRLPIFGVTYADQNQRYFKNITIGMDSPKVTDESIKAKMYIASKGDDNSVLPVGTYGQDLFDVYANNSYQCKVEMMGCAQIMPLMYFQLNNIPMFKGTYMVINVSHSITNGNFTTNFTGIRLNKDKMKLVENVFDIDPNIIMAYSKNKTTSPDVVSLIDENYISDIKKYIKETYIKPENLGFDVNGITTMSEAKTKLKEMNAEFTSSDDRYERLSKYMRKKMFEIAKAVNDNFNNEGNRFTTVFTSGARPMPTPETRSDHNYLYSVPDGAVESVRSYINGSSDPKGNSSFISSVRVKRYMIKDDMNPAYYTNGEINGSYDFVNNCLCDKGCALDVNLIGPDGKNYNELLYDLILYIMEGNYRQAIFEVNGDGSNHCVHIASYGDGNMNDVHSAFYSFYENGNYRNKNTNIGNIVNYLTMKKRVKGTDARLNPKVESEFPNYDADKLYA